MARVEFVDYTGNYPCLCPGEVTLKIDGQVVNFVKSKYESEESGKPYLSLTSGGYWSIDLDPRYAELEDEILEVINSNIPWGCCGDCCGGCL